MANFRGKQALAKADELGIDYTVTGKDRFSTEIAAIRDAIFEEQGVEYDENTISLNNDNSDMRRLVEHCVVKSKVVVNPIIDWTDDDVWEYIDNEHEPYCSLYTHGGNEGGAKRLGCIGCPMNSKREQELEDYPKYREMYLRSFEKMLQARRNAGLATE